LPGGLADIDGKKSHLKGIHNFWNTVQDVFQKIFFHYKPMENISIKPNIHVVLFIPKNRIYQIKHTSANPCWLITIVETNLSHHRCTLQGHFERSLDQSDTF
jgi:hypothetical protein